MDVAVISEAKSRALDWIRGDRSVEGLALTGLTQVGLLGGSRELDSYAAIASADEVILSEAGLPGYGMLFSVRQLVARFFILGFGSDKQKDVWLPRFRDGKAWPAIAISEPGAGAHPKYLATSASQKGNKYVLTGKKTWVTNGGHADVFLVLGVTSVQEGRKSFGLFLVPRTTPGLEVKRMDLGGLLAPASHAELILNHCEVSACHRLGDSRDAYRSMAEPFRDVEDVVVAAGTAGFVQWMIKRAAKLVAHSEENALLLGRFTALQLMCSISAQNAVSGLDNGASEGALIAAGVRDLASSIVDQLRGSVPKDVLERDSDLQNAFAAFDLMSSTAKRARATRLARLGNSLLVVDNRDMPRSSE
ncbi:acyl-CoA dehydrogenase [Bradyrhizobium sp. USDA 4461]